MEIIISNGPVSRTFRGSYEDLHSKDWNELVREVIDAANDY